MNNDVMGRFRDAGGGACATAGSSSRLPPSLPSHLLFRRLDESITRSHEAASSLNSDSSTIAFDSYKYLDIPFTARYIYTITNMAWTRPKKPNHPIPIDPVEEFGPLLNFISGRRYHSNPSPTRKPVTPRVPREITNDPILQSFQQAQGAQAQEDRPNTSHSQKTSKSKRPHQEQIYQQVIDHDYDEPPSRTRKQAPTYYEPPPPPPPPILRPKPRVASYERPRPKPKVADQPVPRYMPSLQYVKAQPSGSSSSTWASATTPLEL